jgi:hypothetical protein
LSAVTIEIRREESAKKPPGAAISRGELRRIIQERMATDSELTAFLIDYFPEVDGYMTNGMNRVDKVNVLLERVKPEAIWGHLVEAHPEVLSLRR